MIQYDNNEKLRKIVDRFLKIKTHGGNNNPSPHKPLLLIWAISKCLQDQFSLDTWQQSLLPHNFNKDVTKLEATSKRLMPYSYYKEIVEKELSPFSMFKTKIRIDMPYWYLTFDGVWEWNISTDLIPAHTGRQPIKQYYRSSSAGLLEDDYNAISANPGLGLSLIYSLLDKFFPVTLHEDIIDAAHVPVHELQSLETKDGQSQETIERKVRSSIFRKKVIEAYTKQCAVCRHSVWISDHENLSPLALEAAHIKSHCWSGPDEICNGLALCSTHHALFDRGAYTLKPVSDNNYVMLVSDKVFVRTNDIWLAQYNNSTLHLPQYQEQRPNPEYVEWHTQFVFKGGQ